LDVGLIHFNLYLTLVTSKQEWNSWKLKLYAYRVLPGKLEETRPFGIPKRK